MLLPALVDFADGDADWLVFFSSSIATFFIGGLLILSNQDDQPVQLSVKDGFLLTTACWVVVAAFAAMPFIGVGLNYTDAYFEAMSGLTTTGSTVLTKLDQLPRGVLLWRAILQGLGGLGIIVTAMIMLPFLRVGGMQLFQMEQSDRSEKVLPRALELTTAIASFYVAMIIACSLTYGALGMTAFDAVCHALTTVSTGGLSTHDESFGFFKSAPLEWACIVFMILGSLPFVVYIKAWRGNPSAIFEDAQVRGLLGFLLGVCLIVTFWLMTAREMHFAEALRKATFNVTSIVTTTGYASTDYTDWGTFAIGLFFLLMFVGGCAGSTTGGIKIYRLQVTGLLIRSHFVHLMSPNRVVTLVYNGRRLPADVPFSVVAFLAIYMSTVGLFTVVLAAMGLDLVTALSASAQAVGNVGPGLGEIVGPSGNYSGLPPLAKWILSFAMMMGRLELFTVLVLLRIEFWRN
ncbi:MAG: TrkH family potassium uptake protein [Alphaproteobacteria bacterium]|nr:TrkH family potassium uptake protein [Alphaproteobacteria bacterium]